MSFHFPARDPAFNVRQGLESAKKRTAPISLLISPNLDALLEHEERTRALSEPRTPDSYSQQVSPVSVAPSAELSIGLPPPPRRSRGPKSPRTPLSGNLRSNPLFPEHIEPLGRETRDEVAPIQAVPLSPVSSSTSNPYINPAPTLDEVLRVGITSQLSDSIQATTVKKLPREYEEVDEDDEQKTKRENRDGSAVTALPWSPIDITNCSNDNSKQRSHSKYPSLPLPYGKSVDAATQNLEASQPTFSKAGSPFTSILTHPLIAAQSRRRKIMKQKEGSVPDMQQATLPSPDDSERGRGALNSGVASIPWRRRPLISHAPQSSVSSSDSTSTSSTNDPPSTAEHEPRISISSTIYPASSSHSHPQSLYNEPNNDMMTMYRDSFMEIYSPTNPEFNTGNNSPDATRRDPISPIHFAASPISQVTTNSFEVDNERSHSPKPPIPTTPKPLFTRPALRSRGSSPMPSLSPSFSKDKDQKISEKPLPPTTNFLDMDERADLIRKSRKLARVFGQTPDADAMAQQDSGRSITSTLMNGQPRNRVALSLANDPQRPPRSAWRSPPDSFHLTGSRRHSMPLSPDDISFLSIVSPTFENQPNPRTTNLQLEIEGVSSSDLPVNHAITQNRSNSPTSFIDLSDDEGTKPGKKAATPRSHSPSQSILTMTPDEQADEERRRKRERLAKLHRFLGSRVPANLVLGIDDLEASLPPPQRAPTSSKGASSESDDSSRKTWLKRRRSSSAAILPSSWPEELERVKEELDDKEKALNVRRAHKMEKVFGVAPPQTLYHTRHCPAPSVAVKPVAPIPVAITPDAQAPQPAQRNPNRSAYVKTKTKKNNRPGTSESSKQLLPKDSGNSGFGDHHSLNPGHSLIYNHYQHSLNSLNDILDKDDKESLAELHEYLNNADLPTPTPTAEESFANRIERRLSVASSIKSERRRSLPARTSMISLASEYSVTTPKPEITSFQLRRRRAAKLAQFFGVNYRELINDVLESIENGVEHEQQRGTLRAEEVEDLLTKLRTLKAKRTSLF